MNIVVKFHQNSMCIFREEVAGICGQTDLRRQTTRHPISSPELRSRWAKKLSTHFLQQESYKGSVIFTFMTMTPNKRPRKAFLKRNNVKVLKLLTWSQTSKWQAVRLEEFVEDRYRENMQQIKKCGRTNGPLSKEQTWSSLASKGRSHKIQHCRTPRHSWIWHLWTPHIRGL